MPMLNSELVQPFPDDLTSIAFIQVLIPIGLAAVADQLEREVERLCAKKHARRGKTVSKRRWGVNAARCIWPIRKWRFPYCGFAMSRPTRKRP